MSLALALPLTISCGRNSGDGVERLAANTGAVNETQLLQDLHKDNQKEIAVANLAAQKAETPAVKDFAKEIAKDHQQADKRVTDLQQRLTAGGGTQPTTPTQPTQPTTPAAPAAPANPSTPAAPGGTGGTSPGNPGAGPAAPAAPAAPASPSRPSDPSFGMLEQLRNLRGVDFDKKFLGMMVTEHQQGIAKLQAAQSSLTNKDVLALVKDLLPVYEKHLKAAQQLQQQLGGGSEKGELGKGKQQEQGKGKLQEQGMEKPLPIPPKKGEGNGMQEQGKTEFPPAPKKPEGGSLGSGEQQQQKFFEEGKLPEQPKQPTPPAGGLKKQPGTPSTPGTPENPSLPIAPGEQGGSGSQGGHLRHQPSGIQP